MKSATNWGEDAKTCLQLEQEGFLEPWRIHSRNPRRQEPAQLKNT
jgi:hypothetical protein